MKQVASSKHLHTAAAIVLAVWPVSASAPQGAGQERPSSVSESAAAALPGTHTSNEVLQSVSKRIEAELAVEPRAAAPGAAVKLLYMVSSYEAQDERVRLRVEAGPGWRLLDTSIERRELLLEKWENIEGELYLFVPDQARVGDRQLVRLLVEVVGESGVIQAQSYVSVSRRGGARPGLPVVSATATASLSQLGAGGFENAYKGRAATVSTKFGAGSTFSLFYDDGVRENLSNYRFEEQRTRLSGNFRHAGWDVTFGNYVSSPGQTLAGPFVLGRGVSVTRPVGRLIAEVVAAQPNTIGSEAGGRLLRGRAGVRTPRGSLGFVVSDFDRPAGGYTTLSRVQQTVLDADSEERLEIERRVTADAASNRVTGFGLDAEFRPTQAQRFTVRTGGLWLSNAAGARASGLAAEASYSYATKPANVNVRWRQTPPTVQGVSIFGDEFAADASVRLAGDLRLVGYTYVNNADTVGSVLSSSGNGTSFGVRFTRGKSRLELRGNYRESQFTTRSLRRTVSVQAAGPVGPLSFSATADVGRQNSGWLAGRVGFYRGDLRWVRVGSSVTFSVTHSDGYGSTRERADLTLALKVRSMEVAGGAWATRGYASGGSPGAWTSIGLPIGGDRFVIVGGDYSSVTWTARPTLRGTLAIRQGFTIPLPFIKATALSAEPSLDTHAERSAR